MVQTLYSPAGTINDFLIQLNNTGTSAIGLLTINFNSGLAAVTENAINVFGNQILSALQSGRRLMIRYVIKFNF